MEWNYESETLDERAEQTDELLIRVRTGESATVDEIHAAGNKMHSCLRRHAASRMRTFTPTRYDVVSHLFVQSDPTFNSTDYNLLTDSFGLLDKAPQRWATFAALVDKLNSEADHNTSYKVLYLARHGQGDHNVAESHYGTALWDSHYSKLTTDGTSPPWGPDAKLTPLGISQAQSVNLAWKEQIVSSIPLPQVLYVSPFSRSASTLRLTWHDILIDPHGMKPIFKEMWRETIGLHTCDQRDMATYLKGAYPGFVFEEPFAEEDELWGSDYQETPSQHALRTQQILNQLFATDASTYVSLTVHSGVIRSILTVVNHPQVFVQPGGFIPLVIRATFDPSVPVVPSPYPPPPPGKLWTKVSAKTPSLEKIP